MDYHDTPCHVMIHCRISATAEKIEGADLSPIGNTLPTYTLSSGATEHFGMLAEYPSFP